MTDLFPPAPDDRPSPEERAELRRRRDRASVTRSIGWVLLVAAIVGVLVLGNSPSPYVIERPGPVFDTLGEVVIDGEQVALIQIDGARSYPTEGALDLLTVRIAGSRENPPSWIDVATAWFQPGHAVVPIELVYPEERSDEEIDEQSRLDMQTSQQEAIAAALGALGIEYSSVVEVFEVEPGLPADGVLEAGDLILDVAGAPTPDVSVLRDEIGAHGVDEPLEFRILRDGEELTVELTPTYAADGATPIAGIVVGGRYDFPFEVSIQLENVGGPSAGIMFALGIYDKLTPGPLTGGEHVAGTGTIRADGIVGAIGGIEQKMQGARDRGAEWFLAPVENCRDVVGNIPGGLDVFAVSTLDEALAVLDAVSSRSDTSALARCGS